MDEGTNPAPNDSFQHVQAPGNPNTVKVGIGVFVALILLGGGSFAAYQYSKQKNGTVVLPGGITYLGPTKSDASTNTTPAVEGTTVSKFTIDPTTPWVEDKGHVFSYTFSYPKTLALAFFPNDPTDSVAISWNNIPPQEDILLRVDLLQNNDATRQYINQPKRTYVDNWWKQYSGLKGVSSITEFVNAKGLKGYRAKYFNYANQTPNEDVFFEVPDHADFMVLFSNGPLEQTVFDRIIDSFDWHVPAPSKASPTVPATSNAGQGGVSGN